VPEIVDHMLCNEDNSCGGYITRPSYFSLDLAHLANEKFETKGPELGASILRIVIVFPVLV
jgi:hypothetical protein